MKILIKPEDIKIIDDINKYDLNKNNIYNIFASLGEFKQNYDQNLKNLKDLFICQLLSSKYKNFSIFVNLNSNPIPNDRLIKLSQSYDILIDFKDNYDVIQLSKNIIILDYKIINYLKNYFIKRIDKVTFNFNSNENVNIKILDEFLSLLTDDGKLIFDLTKYKETIYDEKVNYSKIFVKDPVNPNKICINYDTTDFSSFIFGRKFRNPKIITPNDLLDYKDIYCFLKDRYNKYDFDIDIKIFDLSVDISDITKVNLLSKFNKEEIDKFCKDGTNPIILPHVNADDQFEFKKEVIMDFEFLKQETLDNFSFLKKSIKKDTTDIFSEFKTFDFGLGGNTYNSERMAYVIFTRAKVDSKKLLDGLKELYFKNFMDVFTHTENLCKNELEYLKEKRIINDTEDGRLQKSLLEFRGYY
jgi:hypothetical protein